MKKDMETSITQIINTQGLGERTQAGIRNVLFVMKFLPKGTREQTDRVGDTRKRRQRGAKLRKLKPRTEKIILSQKGQHRPVISATGRLRWEGHKFKVRPGNLVRASQESWTAAQY